MAVPYMLTFSRKHVQVIHGCGSSPYLNGRGSFKEEVPAAPLVPL